MKAKQRRRWPWILLLAAIVGLSYLCSFYGVFSGVIRTENLLDEYYLSFPGRLRDLQMPSGLDLWGENYVRVYKTTYGDYPGEDVPGMSEDRRIYIVVNKWKRTVKFVDCPSYREEGYWYRFVYDAGEKTLTYETSDPSAKEQAEERKDFLFSFVLEKWMEECGSKRYTLENPGQWEGVRP